MELNDSRINGFLVWVHDVEILMGISISRCHTAGAIEVLIRDAPGWHCFELISEESSDIVHSEVGFESAIEGAKDVGIMRKESGRFGDFVHDKADDLFLVFATVAVASRIGVALTGKGEGTTAVSIVIARVKSTTFIGPASERIVYIGINVDTINCIDKVFDEIEVDTNVVVNINAKKLGDGGFGELDAASRASVGELIV